MKYQQVADRVVELIESGTLVAGQRIPSVREMARQMGTSVMTVLEGYGRLADRGLIESQPQSGYYVRPAALRHGGATARLAPARPDSIRLASSEVWLTDLAWAFAAQLWRPDLVPLGSGVPNPTLLPADALARHVSRAVRREAAAANSHTFGAGLPELRTQLALRMLDVGCTTSPDEVIVTVGATEALSIAVQAVARPGDAVAVESPGYLGFFALLDRLRINAVEVETDPTDGISLPVMERAFAQHRRLRAVVLCPTHSNPTGACMPLGHRTELVAMCRRAGAVIVEDDALGYLSFSGERPKALKALDPDSVIYVGSLSKMLAPGYRIGWVCGGHRRQEIMRHHLMAVLSVPAVCQMATAAYLAGGGVARHLRRLRQRCATNVALCHHAIAQEFPAGTRVTHPDGGFFLWVELPRGCDARLVAKAGVSRGLSVAPGRLFSSRGHYGRFLRLNASFASDERFAAALAALGGIVKQAIPRGRVKR
jgi:DNA-binding transcriptional MocR family regulator